MATLGRLTISPSEKTSAVTKQQEFLVRACNAVGLKITLNYEVRLKDGRAVSASAHIAGVGPPRGMLIFSSRSQVCDAESELTASGFGCSTYGEPAANEQFDLEGHLEMFADWNGGNLLVN